MALGGTRLGDDINVLFRILDKYFSNMFDDNNSIFHNYKNDLDKNVLYLHDYK